MSKRKKRLKQLDPERVARGLDSASIDELFSLIHRVNPSRESAQEPDYALKSALQSLLIENHHGSLLVERTEDPVIVGLRHKHNRRDACHARTHSLSESARSWVQQQLDFEQSPGEAPKTENTPPSIATAPENHTNVCGVQHGRAALAEYDFELARTCFTNAWKNGESLEARLAGLRGLLELIVDHLADYEEALSFFDKIPEIAREDRIVGGYFAQAAAYLGQIDRALEFSRRIEDSALDKVHLGLAQHAMLTGNFEEAHVFLEPIASHSEFAPLAQSMREEVRRRRTQLAFSLEPELSLKLSQHEWEGAEVLARRILELSEDSTVARESLRTIATHRKSQEAKSIGPMIESALNNGRLSLARSLLRDAEDKGHVFAELDARLEGALREESAKKREDRHRALSESFEAHLTPEAVQEYWHLDDSDRRELKSRVTSETLTWIEEIGPVRSSGACRMVTAALNAFKAARSLGDNETASSLIAPHAEVLRGFDTGRRWISDLEADLAALRHERMTILLNQCEAIENEEELRARLGSVLERDLSESGRKRFEQQKARLNQLEHRSRLEAEYTRTMAADDWFKSRSTIDKHVGHLEAMEQEAWNRRRSDLSESIRKVCVLCHVEGIDSETDFEPMLCYDYWDCKQILTDTGDLVLVQWKSGLLFIKVICSQTGRKRGAILRAPGTRGELYYQVEAQRVWLLGENWYLRVNLLDFDIEDYGYIASPTKGRFSLEPEFVVDRTKHGWFIERQDHGPDRSVLIDLVSGEIRRDVKGIIAMHSIIGSSPLSAAAIRLEPGILILTDRGNRLVDDSVELESLCGAVTHPTKDGFILLMSRPIDLDEDDSILILKERTADGVQSEVVLNEADAIQRYEIASLRREECILLLYFENQDAYLAAYELTERGFAQLYRKKISRDTNLAVDSAAQYVGALTSNSRRCGFFRVGRDESIIPDWACEDEARERLNFHGHQYCTIHPGSSARQNDAASQELMAHDSFEVERRLKSLLNDHHEDVDLLVSLHSALGVQHFRLRHLVTTVLIAHHLEHPYVSVLKANQLFDENQWGECLELLNRIDIERFDEKLVADSTRQHFYHLRGLSKLHRGYIREGRDDLVRGKAIDSDACKLSSVIADLEALFPSMGDESNSSSVLGTLMNVLRNGDVELAAGSSAKARMQLNCAEIWSHPCDQGLARLACAYLLHEPATNDELFQKALALSSFVYHMEGRFTSFLPIGQDSWSHNRIQETLQRSTAWLIKQFDLKTVNPFKIHK